ncbi:hypothetical protein [uncultured Polaribacter sp.]|uniref:hypothetical protein n=1 Tax=uncultured Polaribacter sp. TaxID=174711 RepID=UPI00260C0BC3|nr:hypothetical protein [uncultured Polaribacter sp.]
MKHIFSFLFVFCLINTSFAQKTPLNNDKSWYVPDYTTVQLAGNIGFLSTGIGYEIFDDVWYAELLYGFVPPSISDADAIHLITIKNTFPIFTKDLGNNYSISPIAGLGFTYDVGPNTFTTLPSRFPAGYYVPNAFHFTVFVGGKLHKEFANATTFKGVDLYFELGTVDSYLWTLITTNEFTLSDAFSTAIGVNLYF